MEKIDIERSDFYEYGKPDLKERTKQRLVEMAEMGMEEVGIASFGVRNVVGGLYIERVWSHSDEEWTSYMKWVQSVIDRKK